MKEGRIPTADESKDPWTGTPPSSALEPKSSLLLVASLLVAVAGFWPTIRSFPAVWSGYDYSHGYFVALLTVWFLWRKRSIIMGSPEGWGTALLTLLPR